MAISEELQRRISSLTGEETPRQQGMMMSADGQRPFADISLPESLSRRQPDLGIYQNQDIKEILTDFRTQASAGNAREASEAYIPRLEEMTGMNRNDPDFRAMLRGAGLTGGSGGRMSEQDMNMMIAQQGARQGISPVEQRAMAFTSYLNTTDRTAPEEVVNNYAMGNMSFDDAIQLSQPIQVIDEVTVTGQMPETGQMSQAEGERLKMDIFDSIRQRLGGRMTEREGQRLQEAMFGNDNSAVSNEKLMELQKALQELEAQRQMTNDPEEKELLGRMIENTTTKALAPQADLVDQLSQGAGEDDMMAHVRSGDINVSREMLENNPQLEDMIEQAAIEVGIDPESMVYGTGIASLNEFTGAEQHGFLKKVAKGIKKVAKVIAPVAAVVPGPWQAPAIAYNRGRAVVNIAKGKGGIGDLMTAAGGFGGDSKIGKFIGDSKIGKAFGESKIGQFFGAGEGGSGFFNPAEGTKGIFGGSIGPSFRKGIGGLFGGGEGGSGFFNPAEDATGIFGGSIGPAFRRGIGGLFGGGGLPQPVQGEGGELIYQDAEGNVITQQEYEQLASQQGRFFGRKTPQLIKSVGDAFGFGGASGLRDVYGGDVMTDSQGNPIIDPTTGQPMRSGFLRNAQGGLSGMGMLGIGALATGLGKLAYEDTKKDKGVQLTPLNTMNAAGRYNLEAEIARRMGQRAPNPTEFGLLPANTMPQLSGGQPREMMYGGAVEDLEGGMARGMQEGGEVQYPNKGLESLARVAPDVVKRMGYNMGGYVMPMAYAKGGNVAIEDFDRMNGQINGEGTETSDDVPAMLSDGEFVMTGQAVRGAGSYNMNNESGIITLSPTGAPSRDGGTDLMYQLMEAFSSQARPA
jgi:polyhydroxyalkanoate synthesis regulator phasin